MKFADFKQPTSGYFIQPDTFSANNIDDTDKKINKKKLYWRIGLGALAVVLTSATLIKAMPKSAIKKFESLKQYLEKKIEQEATDSKRAVFYRTALKTMTGFGEKCQGMNNIISFKDIWFKRKITDKVPILDRACRAITRGFNSIGRFTVKRAYKSTGKKFENLNEILATYERELLVRDKASLITINGETKTVEQWVSTLGLKRKDVQTKVTNNFSVASMDERYEEIQRIMSTLEDKVWGESFGNFRNFMKKDTYFTFVAAKILAVEKAGFGQGIHRLRSEISYNVADRVTACRDLLLLNKKLLNPKDSVSEKLYQEIYKQFAELEKYETGSPAYSKLQQELSSKLEQFSRSVKSGSETYKYDEKILEAVAEHEKIIGEILASNKQGKLDEMLEIYKKLLPEAEFNKLQKEVQGAVRSLDNSIEQESVKYFDKRRDLTLGSAPTDILSVLIGFGSLGIGLAKADDRDTQASIAIKYGIPAIGGMLTSMVMTSMLVAGGKSLSAGLVSSFVMNRIGVEVDKLRRSHNKESGKTVN